MEGSVKMSYVISSDPVNMGEVIAALIRQKHEVEVSVDYDMGFTILNYHIGEYDETTIVSRDNDRLVIESTRPLGDGILSEIEVGFRKCVTGSSGGIEKIVASGLRSLREQADLKRKTNLDSP